MDVLQFPNAANKNAVPGTRVEPPMLINHDLVSDLELMLLWAKTGELSSFAWTGIDSEGHQRSGYQVLTVDDQPQLLGQVELLHSEYLGAIE